MTPRRSSPSVVYRWQDACYINLTNRCPTACTFCVKAAWEMSYRGHDLRLAQEPSALEVIDRITEPADCREIVFCGYGEPTYRMGILREVCAKLRERGARRIRLNTIGLGNLVQKRDIVPELADSVDAVSISLNAGDSRQWVDIHRPSPRWRGRGFEAVLEFIRSCRRRRLETIVTAVDLPHVDTAAVRRLAKGLDASFRLRPMLEGIS